MSDDLRYFAVFEALDDLDMTYARTKVNLDLFQLDSWYDQSDSVTHKTGELVLRLGLRSGNTYTVVIRNQTFEEFSEDMVLKLRSAGEAWNA